MAGRIAYYGGIVTNGLVLALDAAKKDSYPGAGTVWREISGKMKGYRISDIGYRTLTAVHFPYPISHILSPLHGPEGR